ncbi:hypothetical protein [Paenibacillus sp. FSL R10-2736]|uniref:hypothetical protein n=1 Tax=Paenibacillus sp. FSL R10-2736 TaxID=2954692 RepID=UPI0030F76408
MFNLSEKEKKMLVTKIKELSSGINDKYPDNKFPDAPYQKYLTVFSKPNEVLPEDIKKALEWQYGHSNNRNTVKAHKRVIQIVQHEWRVFCQSNCQNASEVFQFWRTRLADEAYMYPISFITHLMYPEEIENTGEYHHLAVCYLIKQIKPEWSFQGSRLDFKYLKEYSLLFQTITSKLEIHADSHRLLDKFLRTYGTRIQFLQRSSVKKKIHDEKLIAEQDFKSERFVLSNVIRKHNADKLFICLLQIIEEKQLQINNLTIGQIADLVPQGTAGIKHYASYQYAMLSLFTIVRNYFLFDHHPDLKVAFTKQANNPNRNINFWKSYYDEPVSIHPDILKQI